LAGRGMARQGNAGKACNKMNEKLIHSVAKKWQGRCCYVTVEDLEQEARLTCLLVERQHKTECDTSLEALQWVACMRALNRYCWKYALPISGCLRRMPSSQKTNLVRIPIAEIAETSASASDSERITAAHMKIEQVEQQFLGDAEVLLVIAGLATEMNGPEIQCELSITKNQYEAIMTRIRRGIDQKEGWKP